MTHLETQRCPSCDTSNPGHAAFCTTCGEPLGSGAAAPPSHMHPSAVGGTEDGGLRSYTIGAIAVASVLIVGGALFLLDDSDERDDTAGAAPSPSVSSSVAAVPSTPAPTDATAVSAAPEVASIQATTAPPVPTAPPTAPQPTPTQPPPVPTLAQPAPQPTPAPVAGVTLSFAQADNFYRSYIATAVNGDYNAAWNMLSSSDQADYTTGFDQFVGFWRRVSFAEVQRVESVGGSAGFQSLVVDMAYGQADGDPTSFEVVEVDVNVRPDGSFQIFDYRYIRNQ